MNKTYKFKAKEKIKNDLSVTAFLSILFLLFKAFDVNTELLLGTAFLTVITLLNLLATPFKNPNDKTIELSPTGILYQENHYEWSKIELKDNKFEIYDKIKLRYKYYDSELKNDIEQASDQVDI